MPAPIASFRLPRSWAVRSVLALASSALFVAVALRGAGPARLERPEPRAEVVRALVLLGAVCLAGGAAFVLRAFLLGRPLLAVHADALEVVPMPGLAPMRVEWRHVRRAWVTADPHALWIDIDVDAHLAAREEPLAVVWALRLGSATGRAPIQLASTLLPVPLEAVERAIAEGRSAGPSAPTTTPGG